MREATNVRTVTIGDQEFTLNEGQTRALELVESGKNVFITGSGGVGKSVLIHAIEQSLSNTLLCAPTGVAALNIGGSTLHRIFTLPLAIATTLDAFSISKYSRLLCETAKAIIIDEVSMVRSDMFTLVDKKLRRIKDNDEPFGGLQVIVVGDFYQLSPVLIGKDRKAFRAVYESPFCFKTDSWRGANFETCDLTEVMRQSDEETIELFNNIRQGKFLSTSLDILNETCGSTYESDEEPIILCTTNATVDGINEYEYSKVEGPEENFRGRITGEFKDFPVDKSIDLKIGTKVVICANNHETGYYNGDTGVYEGVLEVNEAGEIKEGLLVRLNRTKQTVLVTPHTWENVAYEVVAGVLTKEVIGTYKQLPIKLGYAITIHKSQGMSFDRAHINLGTGAFTHGQTYVALSRIRSLEGLTLDSPVRKSDIIIDPEVQTFYDG